MRSRAGREDLRPRLGAIKAPTLVMGSWIAYKNTSTLEANRDVYEHKYKLLAIVKITMSSAARHFIMLDGPAWYEATLEVFVQ